MSQVIVTKDNLNEKRERSRIQEQNIDRDGFLNHWKKATDVTKPSIAATIIGIAVLPVVGFWALILFLMSICLTIFVGLMRGLGAILSSFKR